jgi:2-oxoglutarate ferredoxin oxidoreductase subunit gamma
VDTTHVQRPPSLRAIRADLTTWAVEATEHEITASVVALGFLVGLTDLIARQALEEAVISRAPRGTREINLQALDRGFAEAERLRGLS